MIYHNFPNIEGTSDHWCFTSLIIWDNIQKKNLLPKENCFLPRVDLHLEGLCRPEKQYTIKSEDIKTLNVPSRAENTLKRGT